MIAAIFRLTSLWGSFYHKRNLGWRSSTLIVCCKPVRLLKAIHQIGTYPSVRKYMYRVLKWRPVGLVTVGGGDLSTLMERKLMFPIGLEILEWSWDVVLEKKPGKVRSRQINYLSKRRRWIRKSKTQMLGLCGEDIAGESNEK